jgi:hypothetical protein
MIVEFLKHFEWKKLGRDHIESKVPCQDSVAYGSHEGIQVLAVADGAGSRKFSQHGSKIAVEQMVKVLSSNFREVSQRMEKVGKKKNQFENDQLFLKEWFQKSILSEMEIFAKANQITINDMACTLLFVAFNENHYVAGHIGDGIIASIHGVPGQEYTKLISEPEGEANETFFVTMAKLAPHFRIASGSMDQIRGFLVTTDGIQDRIYQKRIGLSSNLNVLIQAYFRKNNEQYKSFIEELIETRWTDLNDDLSLVMMIRENQPLIEENVPYLKEMLSVIKSKEQITKLSTYAYFLDGSKGYLKTDYVSTEALIEQLMNGL